MGWRNYATIGFCRRHVRHCRSHEGGWPVDREGDTVWVRWDNGHPRDPPMRVHASELEFWTASVPEDIG